MRVKRNTSEEKQRENRGKVAHASPARSAVRRRPEIPAAATVGIHACPCHDGPPTAQGKCKISARSRATPLVECTVTEGKRCTDGRGMRAQRARHAAWVTGEDRGKEGVRKGVNEGDGMEMGGAP